MSSMFNGIIKIALWGESHGLNIGVIIENLPYGVKIDLEKIKYQMQKRAPGQDNINSQRQEIDSFDIVSGIKDFYTTGAPLCAIIKNKDIISHSYKNLEDIPRPGHADFTAHIKYKGFNQKNGGGHFSGRLTAPLTLAGAICEQILENYNVKIAAHISCIEKIKDFEFEPTNISEKTLSALKNQKWPLLNKKILPLIEQKLLEMKMNQESIGGKIECAAIGVPIGIGGPWFSSLKSVIAALMFAVPAVAGLEFGAGFKSLENLGSQNNDEFFVENNKILTKTNNHGGILGGISSGMPIIFDCAIKPVPSIFKEQNTVNLKTRKNTKIKIEGRHDVCIVPRLVPVVESVTAIALLNAILENKIIN